ncbi:MAG: hypothetical protein AAGU32_11285, partial [Bacillota bacterium]
TYAGTVNAYSLDASSSGNTSASGNAAASDRSLFVANYNISHTVSWNALNGAGLIFGKAYNAGGVAYKLRSLSVGSSNNGQFEDDQRGTPETNEWDQILNKDRAYLKNWNWIFSWGQDTWVSYAAYRVLRSYTFAYTWTYRDKADALSSYGFRPALEILAPDTLGADGLKTVTYDMGGNGTLGSGSLASATVVYTGSLTLPEITSVNGFTYTGTGTGTPGWYAGTVFHPAGTSPVLASGTILKAGMSTEITGDFTDANFLAEVRTALGKGASDPICDTDNFASVTSLNVSGKNISSLAGIEYFTALTSLNCSDNYLESLDVSNNTALTSLNCGFNQLTSLDVSGNTALTSLNCGYNQIPSLDVSNNTNLTWLDCKYNYMPDESAVTGFDAGPTTIFSFDPQHSGQPPVSAVRPSITGQPAGAAYVQNASVTPLSVSASVTDSGTLSYQWYKNASNRTTGGIPVGINSSGYTPLTNTVGTAWYYCVVTNTNPGATGNQTAAATSSTAAVTVNAPGDNGGGSTPSTTTPATPQTQPNQPTAGMAPVTAIAGVNGTASADIPDKAIT